MAAAPGTCWVTTVLARNIHCTSCVSFIKGVFSQYGQQVHDVNISILRQTVEVRHRSSLSPRDICFTLAQSAFDITSASANDEQGRRVEDLDFENQDGWLEAALERWNSPRSKQIILHHPFVTEIGLDRKARHLQNCAACRAEGSVEPEPTLVPERSGTMQLGSTKPRHKRTAGKRGSADGVEDLRSPSTAKTHVLTVLIGGMTCASCASAITAAVQGLDFVLDVEVNLLTNSAVVKYVAAEQKTEAVLNTIEDAGFEASATDLKQSNLMSISANEKGAIEKEPQRRSVMLKIDGMFCNHCPSRILEGLSARYPGLLEIEEPPSLKTPILKLSYRPEQGALGIRDIVSTISGVSTEFDTIVYHPPSLEDRSQLMQAKEQRKLLKRLLLCCLVVIPTLLVGVVWMSVVPMSNPIRQYFDVPIWAGTVTRAQWALFILATPVMFFAADVFHLRAIKEIRALWRPKSHVPILRKFYRFGSMNLLISAGTSVAYVSSVALLVRSATVSPKRPANNTTYFDSVVFLTFFILIGKYLEAYSKAKTGNAVAMLGKLRPQEAILVNPSANVDNKSESSNDNSEFDNVEVIPSSTQAISVDLLEIGDTVLVPNGSSPPGDGTVATGSSKFNESSLTGESREATKTEGDQVYAGTVNVGNPVRVEITSLGGASMLDQIISVVREGQTKRAPVERVVDTLTGYFVPVITALAIVTFIIWFALGQSGQLSARYLDNQQGGWAFWSLEFAIAVFVVACPCGIGLAAPTALFVGGGLAARNGILVRGGGEAFQEASRIDAVVFDKTGTLTEGGDPTVTDHQILIEGEDSKVIWSILAKLEETSSHPLARALLNLASAYPNPSVAAETITEEPGHGLRGTFIFPTGSETKKIYEAAVGSEAFINSLQKSSLLNYFTTTTLFKWKSQSKSIALLAIREFPTASQTSNGDSPSWMLAAIFAISDPIRPSALSTISALQGNGISVYMLTGDNPTTASAVASTLSIPANHVFAGVLPTQKAEKIEWLKDNAPRRTASRCWLARLGRKHSSNKDEKATIAFIGDGINDAPALTSASVSVAISSSTSANDIALSSASFILLSPSLNTLLTLFDLSSLVFRRIKFNFAWALVYNVILVPVAAGALFRVREGGWRLGPVWGSAAMAGSSLSVVGSSLAMGWGWKGKGEGRE